MITICFANQNHSAKFQYHVERERKKTAHPNGISSLFLFISGVCQTIYFSIRTHKMIVIPYPSHMVPKKREKIPALNFIMAFLRLLFSSFSCLASDVRECRMKKTLLVKCYEAFINGHITYLFRQQNHYCYVQRVSRM